MGSFGSFSNILHAFLLFALLFKTWFFLFIELQDSVFSSFKTLPMLVICLWLTRLSLCHKKILLFHDTLNLLVEYHLVFLHGIEFLPPFSNLFVKLVRVLSIYVHISFILFSSCLYIEVHFYEVCGILHPCAYPDLVLSSFCSFLWLVFCNVCVFQYLMSCQTCSYWIQERDLLNQLTWENRYLVVNPLSNIISIICISMEFGSLRCLFPLLYYIISAKFAWRWKGSKSCRRSTDIFWCNWRF